MRTLLVLLAALFIARSYGQADTRLYQLNKAIDQKGAYEKAKQQRIAKYHDQQRQVPRRDLVRQFAIQSKLTEEYKTFQYDSAFSSIQALQKMAYALHDPVRSAYATNQL